VCVSFDRTRSPLSATRAGGPAAAPRTSMRAMDRRIGVLAGFAVLIAALVVVILVGRGGDDEADSASLADTSTKPVIEASDAPAPSSLEIEDIKEGTGPGAKDGDTLSMQYVGALYDTGEEFDASWDRGEPFEFELGSGNVIQGWDQGIKGMKAGGRRKLVIPPDLGYGAAGSPPAIPANATLVFVVDLLEIK